MKRRSFLQMAALGFSTPYAGLSALAGAATNHANNTMDQQEKSLGIALVGLGQYSTGQLAPALQETRKCHLAGVVSGTPGKISAWQKKYDIPEKNCYNYESFDKIRDNPDIDIVYIVLPNALHAEYVIKAAAAGKHVICEKPMALTVEECDRMIAACKQAGRMLSIGYRLHFDPYNKEMMRLGQNRILGPVKKIQAEHGMNGTGGWRLDKKLAGGGPLMDLGVYCIQGVRYTTGKEPVAIWAEEIPAYNPALFKEVEAGLRWRMEMDDGSVAECLTSYENGLNLLRAETGTGWFELSPAYAYSGQQGASSSSKMTFPHVNQQARQMDDFADSILEGRPTPVPGEMGRQDVKIIQAVYEAMRSGKKITL